MKYKVKKGTKLYKALLTLRGRMDECRDAVIALLKEQFGEGQYRFYYRKDAMVGGFTGIEMKVRPEGWGRAFKDVPNVWFPVQNQQNIELLAKIAVLPVVDNSELNRLVNFIPGTVIIGVKHHFFTRPGMILTEDKQYMLIEVPEQMVDYEPVAGMEEIVMSEFNILSGKKKVKTDVGTESK